MSRPIALNLYAYADGNPSRFVDPTGHCPPCLAAVGVLAARALIGGAEGAGSYVLGVVVANAARGKVSLEGFEPRDLLISVAAGAGVGAIGIPPGLTTAKKLTATFALNAGIGAVATAVSGALEGQVDPLETAVSAVLSGVGSLLPVPGRGAPAFALGVVRGGLLNAVQERLFGAAYGPDSDAPGPSPFRPK